MVATSGPPADATIARHRTAMHRRGLSRPVAGALSDGLLDEDSQFFDYGCGRGTDVQLLSAAGITASGWDPTHRPTVPLREADVVNLGYVVNVIEDPDERVEVLQEAWS